MQTTGTVLVAVKRRSPVRMWMLAQDSRSAHGLLYFAAVRDDWPEQEHCQRGVDIDRVQPPSAAHALGLRLPSGSLRHSARI